jgi:hypothetical protein
MINGQMLSTYLYKAWFYNRFQAVENLRVISTEDVMMELDKIYGSHKYFCNSNGEWEHSGSAYPSGTKVKFVRVP